MEGKIFELRTLWNSVFVVGEADRYGNIPKEITPAEGGTYDVSFTHGKYTNRIYGVAFARMGDQKEAQKLDREQEKKWLEKEEARIFKEQEAKLKQFSKKKK